MVASGVLERNAGGKAAPKKMARSRSTRRDARTATRRLASEPSAEVAPPPSSRTLAPSRKGEEPNVLFVTAIRSGTHVLFNKIEPS